MRCEFGVGYGCGMSVCECASSRGQWGGMVVTVCRGCGEGMDWCRWGCGWVKLGKSDMGAGSDKSMGAGEEEGGGNMGGGGARG